MNPLILQKDLLLPVIGVLPNKARTASCLVSVLCLREHAHTIGSAPTLSPGIYDHKAGNLLGLLREEEF